MNGFGIGTSVGSGAIIGLGLVAPGAPLLAYALTFLFYGALGGSAFELVRLIFFWKPPSSTRP
jgi:hypothetical protein